MEPGVSELCLVLSASAASVPTSSSAAPEGGSTSGLEKVEFLNPAVALAVEAV